MTHRVAVLALDNVLAMDLGIASRILNEARDPDGLRLYDVRTCSLGGEPVRTSEGFRVITDDDESLLETADTVVVATQEPDERTLTGGELPARLRAAFARIGPDTRIVSLCTSAFLLAEAGILDGLRATTHWGLCDLLAQRYPAVEVDPDVLFVDNGRVLTGAGAAAGIDLFLHLIRRDFGASVANAASRRCVVAPWREGGQAQFIERPVPHDADRSTSATRQWALRRLNEPLTLQDMARHALMSERTFTRRFRAEVGTSPLKWLAQSRLDEARHLLESTDLTIDRIATVCGFGDPAVLRKHFHARLGLSPQAYRRAHRPPEPSRLEFVRAS
jgi:transcriptional regulator GlxA family with amidase domain